jgi:hypothetical protein
MAELAEARESTLEDFVPVAACGCNRPQTRIAMQTLKPEIATA